MNRRQLFLSTAKAALATAFGSLFPFRGASAQEMTGTPPIGAPPVDVPQTVGAPGSPHATTTIDGRYLPPPPQPFPGQIELKEGRWPARFGTPFVLLTPSAP